LNKVCFFLADCIARPPEYFLDVLGFVPQGDVFNCVLDDFIFRMTMPFEWASSVEALDVFTFKDFRHVRKLRYGEALGTLALKKQRTGLKS
jgi:hypothetical protein